MSTLEALSYSTLWLTIPPLFYYSYLGRDPPRWLWALLTAGGLLCWLSLLRNLMEP